MIKKSIVVVLGILMSGVIYAANPKIAVTDLAYKEEVSEYFSYEAYKEDTSVKGKSSSSSRDSYNSSSERNSDSFSGKRKIDYVKAEGTITRIDIKELRGFLGDVKGEMIKSGSYTLSQPRPYTAKGTEKIYDVINRIKQGMYPGADYVLFGQVSSIEWLNEAGEIPGTNKATQTLGLELVVEFNLVNTKTYEVKAAFSATGEGQDVRILTGSNIVQPSRGKVIREVSKSLGEDAAQQLQAQFSPTSQRSGKVKNRYGKSTTNDSDQSRGEVVELR